MFPKPRGVFLEQKKLRRDPRQLGDFAIFNRRRFLTDKKRACGRILFLIDHRVHEHPKSSQANLSGHPGRITHPCQDRIPWSGYNPPVKDMLGMCFCYLHLFRVISVSIPRGRPLFICFLDRCFYPFSTMGWEDPWAPPLPLPEPKALLAIFLKSASLDFPLWKPFKIDEFGPICQLDVAGQGQPPKWTPMAERSPGPLVFRFCCPLCVHFISISNVGNWQQMTLLEMGYAPSIVYTN